jgi:hypothetical protein
MQVDNPVESKEHRCRSLAPDDACNPPHHYMKKRKNKSAIYN